MTVTLTSRAFDSGAMIPARHTCDGEDLSPPLVWSGVPGGTKSLALVVDAPDAAGAWVHWVLYGLAAERRELPEGVPPEETVLGGARHGRNDFQRVGYGGPCPPPDGAHRYHFTLYAVDGSIDLPPGATKAELLDAIQGRVLGGGRLVGRYRRAG